MAGCDGSGTVRIWTGEEWEKAACEGCENCPVMGTNIHQTMEDAFDKTDAEYYTDGAAAVAAAIRHQAGIVGEMVQAMNEQMSRHTVVPNRKERRKRMRKFRFQR